MMRLRSVVIAVYLTACAGAARQFAPVSATVAPDRSQVPPNGPPPALRVPEQRHFQLSNGLRVRLVELRRLPVVAVNLVIDAGAARDPASLPGLASFTAAMVTEGTRQRTATQISDDLGFIGASLGASTGFDSVLVSGASLSRHLEALLEILGDVVAHPAFPAADFARVQDQRLVALVQQRDDPSAVAQKAFSALFWAGHPYGHWPMGTEGSVKAIRRQDLERFHAATWRPRNSELVVVGDVGEEELRRVLERTLGGWSGGPPPPPPPQTIVQRQRRTVVIEKTGAPQSFLLLGMPGLERSSPDYFAVEVAFQILGGGSSSRLYHGLREKYGYTYGMSAFSQARKLGGSSLIAGSVKADVTGASMKILLEEITALREVPVSPQELADVKGSLVLSLPSEFSTTADIAAKLAEEVVNGLPDDYWNRYAAEVAKVSADDVQRVARRYLDPSRLNTVMVTDVKAAKPQLEGLPMGKIEERAGATAR